MKSDWPAGFFFLTIYFKKSAEYPEKMALTECSEVTEG